MAKTKERNGVVMAQQEVLTLAEAAAYLRVGEPEILALVEADALPARRIGSEWRFLKSAINHWLQTGIREAPSKPAPGTKEAVLQHFGIFKDEDVNEFLDTLRKIRKAVG